MNRENSFLPSWAVPRAFVLIWARAPTWARAWVWSIGALLCVGAPGVWSADTSFDPSRWQFKAKLRLRAESLEDSFRVFAPASDQLQFARTDLSFRYSAETWHFDFEIQDSRAWGAETGSPLGTDDINALEPINVKLTKRWNRADDSSLTLSAGRMTLDYGSRRLLARNNFRNTSNAFQGVHLVRSSTSLTAKAFYTLPLQRLPSGLDREALLDNDFRLDKAGRNERFWGGTVDYRLQKSEATVAAYIFASELRDRPSRPVADRDLTTLGSRATWSQGIVDMEIEAAYQWGDSRSSSVSPSSDTLDHRAWFAHGHLGVQLRPNLNLRIAYDQATGDRDPFDGRNERFDRLYGARAFDLGPSGIFGAAIRSNLRSPALRMLWQSTDAQSWILSHRWLALDSAKDFFVTGARRDSSGESGHDIGGQWELRWRFRPKDSAFSVELGGAYLNKGAYFSGASDALFNPAAPASSRYLFSQLTWSY